MNVTGVQTCALPIYVGRVHHDYGGVWDFVVLKGAEDRAIVGAGLCYSYRNAITGSIRSALRVGIQQARAAMAQSKAVMIANVTGSVGVICTNSPLITRVMASAAASPRTTPITSCLNPVANTIRSTLPVLAPKAMRTPISCVR